MRKFIALVASLTLVFTGLSALPSWATAPADGTYQCESGSFTIASGAVTSHSSCAGAVTVPEGVTSLGWAAFYQSGITSISLPSTLTSIGDSALRHIPTLTTVTIPASVQTIGYLAFGTTPLTQVTFNTPSSLTTIGLDAFQSSEFTSITIPASVTSLAHNAFLGNVNLRNINFSGAIPSSSSWPWSAPADVRVSGQVNCGTTGYFVISENVVLGRKDCTGAVVIPEGVTVIGGEAFDATAGYGNGVGRENPYGSTIGTVITSLTIPNTVTTIGQFAFRDIQASTLVIPDSVTDMGIYAFAGSTATSLTIGDGLTVVPGAAFAGLNNLQSLTIGSGVTSIEGEAFGWARSLNSLTLPDGVETIGIRAFQDVLTPFTLNYCGTASLVDTGLPATASNASSCVPSPPKEVFATPGNGSATISFTPGTSGPSPITNYQYSLDGVTYTDFSPAVTTSPVTITGLTNDVLYTIRLKAKSALGSSAAARVSALPRAPGPAAVPNNGNYSCNTGLPTTASRNYTITNGVVADGSDCIGAIVVANGATSLGNSAFGYSTLIKSIYIPESVTSIDEYAFYQNYSLYAFNVSAENANYSSVGGALLNKSGTRFIQYPQAKKATSFTIPNGVTQIGVEAFKRAAALTSVTIPSGVTTIGDRAFESTGLTSVSVPNGVTSIGDEAFARANSLATVTLPNTLTNLGVRAFLENYALASISLPNGLTEVKAGTFYASTGLTSVTFPSGLTAIGADAFNGTSLQAINFPTRLATIGTAAFYSVDVTSLVIPGSVTSIGDQAFQNLTSLTSLTLQNGIQSIGIASFYGNAGLTSVTIPDSVTSIGATAFALAGAPFTLNYCGNASLAGTGLPSQATNAASCRPAPPLQLTATPGIGSVTFGFTPGAVGGSAISGYKYSLDGTTYSSFSPALTTSSGTITGLTSGTTYSLSLKAVSSIGDSAASLPVTFTALSGAYSNAVIGGVTAPVLGSYPVSEVTAGTGYTGTVTWSDSPTTFAGGTAYTATITLTPLAGYSFAALPANFFTVAGASATNAAGSPIITAVFPATANSAYSSSVIGGVTAPVRGATPSASVAAGTGYTGTVTWSGSPSTFAGGTAYTATITLTPGAGYSFAGVAENFFTVSGAVWATNPANSGEITALFPTTETPYNNLTGAGRVRCVTDGQVAGSGYFEVYNHVVVSSSQCTGAAVIPAGVTRIDEEAFAGQQDLTSVTIPGSVVEIGAYAFAGASALTSISIPAGVTAIQDFTFWGATSLASVTFPQGLVSIGECAFFNASSLATLSLPSSLTNIYPEAFRGASSLTTLVLPNGLQYLGEYAFAGASSLTSVTIPDSLTQIPDAAFDSATSLTSINLPNSITYIGLYAFWANQSLESITIPSSVVEIGEEAFSGATSLANVYFLGNEPARLGFGIFDYVPNGAKALVLPGATGFAAVGTVWRSLMVTESAADGMYACSTGFISTNGSINRYSITSGVVSQGQSCNGAVVLPPGVTEISNDAFTDATGITSINFPITLTSHGMDAFRGANSLTAINVASGNSVYSSVAGVLYNSAGTTLILYPSAKSGNTYTVSGSVTAIAPKAFYGASNLESITFSGNAPSSVGAEAFDGLAASAEALVGATATGFGADGSVWNGLLVRRDSNPQNNTQQTSVQAGPLPAFTVSSRPRISTNGQTLTFTGRNLDSVVSVLVGNKEVRITSKASGLLVIAVPALGEGVHDLGIVHSRGTLLVEGFVQAVKPYAQKRTIQVTAFKAGSPTAASVAALKKSYLAATPANVVSCVARVAANASAKDVNFAAKSAKATCQALTAFSSFINTVNVQVTKTGRTGSKLVVAVTLDRTLTGK